MEEIMIVLQWICGISFSLNLAFSIYKYVQDKEFANLNAAVGWFCALMWVIESAL